MQDYLLGLLEQTPDLTLAELAATLERERGVRVSRRDGVDVSPVVRHEF